MANPNELKFIVEDIDEVAERIDEIADLCEHWKRIRAKGRKPQAVRAALIMSFREVIAQQDMDDAAARHDEET